MKKSLIIPGTVLVILIIFFSAFRAFDNNEATVIKNNNYQTKTSDGEVTIDLTPRKYEGGKFYVDIRVNTHTVALEQFDLKQSITLDYSGASVNPALAPELTGHHNSGLLVFDVNEEPKDFRIVIKGIAGVEERIFEWQAEDN